MGQVALTPRRLRSGLAFLAGGFLLLVVLGSSAGAIERPGAAPAAGGAEDGAPTAAFVSDSMGSTAQDGITAEVTKDRALSYFSAIQGADISITALTSSP
jgi:hypothetical protein